MSVEYDSNVPNATAIIQRVTYVGFFVNLFLVAIKFLAGFFGHSQALIADGVHSLSDTVTDIAILVGSRFWGQPADDSHPYGHAKLEMLVTLLIGGALFFVGLHLIYNAVGNLYEMILNQSEAPRVPNVYALLAAISSIVLKEWLFRITAATGYRIQSSATVANAWHHRSDALSSIPVALAVGAVLVLGEQFAFLDPIGTIVVGLMIFYTAFEIVRPAFENLVDTSGDVHLADMINNRVVSIDGVQSVHKIRTRPLGASLYAVDLHIQVDPDMNVRQAHDLSHLIQNELRTKLPQIVETTVHVEPVRSEVADER